MNVLIAGIEGQLGRALRASAPDWVHLRGADLPEFDICNAEHVGAACSEHAAQLIINAAAYTAVDRAEAERELAFEINAKGARVLAECARDRGARLIHISTDFVFDGTKSTPYLPDDAPNPLNVYGKSKLEGECGTLEILAKNVVVIRTAWLYGKDDGNFVRSILRLLAERDELSVVADQIGTPTWTNSLANAIWKCAAKPELFGVYHWTDAGVASWYDFAVAIHEEALSCGLLDKPCAIIPITTEQYPTPARRPHFSVLDKSAAYRDFDVTPVHWRTNLRKMLREVEK